MIMEPKVTQSKAATPKAIDNRPLTMKQLLDAPRSPIFEVRVRQSEILRVAGNDCFKKKLFKEAIALCK